MLSDIKCCSRKLEMKTKEHLFVLYKRKTDKESKTNKDDI